MRAPDLDVSATRLDLAGTRAFTAPGAGQVRRTAITDFTRSWLVDVWADATNGRRLPGVALAAVGSLGRGDGGPLNTSRTHEIEKLRDVGGIADRRRDDRRGRPARCCAHRR